MLSGSLCAHSRSVRTTSSAATRHFSSTLKGGEEGPPLSGVVTFGLTSGTPGSATPSPSESVAAEVALAVVASSSADMLWRMPPEEGAGFLVLLDTKSSSCRGRAWVIHAVGL